MPRISRALSSSARSLRSRRLIKNDTFSGSASAFFTLKVRDLQLHACRQIVGQPLVFASPRNLVVSVALAVRARISSFSTSVTNSLAT